MQLTSYRVVGNASNHDASETGKERFRVHFQRELNRCLRRRFSVEESFGVVFAETLQEVPLTPAEESELFTELLKWARSCRLG